MKNNIVTNLFLFTALTFACNLKAESAYKHQFTKTENVVWAVKGNFELTMDIYVPKTQRTDYPVLIVYHGGGWLINTEAIMDQMSAYIAGNAEYIVCNVNYRLLTANDNTTGMNEIIEDAFGAVLWVKENIKQYGGNSAKIAVTGDSAGGHLAEMVVLAGNRLETAGFKGNTPGFCPSYLPKGETAESIAAKNGLNVQAAIISYGAFDLVNRIGKGFESDSNFFWQMGKAKARGIFGAGISIETNPEFYKAASPLYNIPLSSNTSLPPQLFTVGSNDNTTPPESILEFVNKLKEAGQPTEYWVHEGRPHAFLDSGSNTYLGIEFEKDAPPAIDKMIEFLNSVFYK